MFHPNGDGPLLVETVSRDHAFAFRVQIDVRFQLRSRSRRALVLVWSEPRHALLQLFGDDKPNKHALVVRVNLYRAYMLDSIVIQKRSIRNKAPRSDDALVSIGATLVFVCLSS